MLTQTNMKVPAILPADNKKYKCLSFFLFLFLLLSLNWERERERESIQLQYLGRVEGENGFKVYLAFRQFSSESIFFFYGLTGFCTAWLEGICYLLSKNSISVSLTGVSAWDHMSFPGDLRPENWILHSYFRWRKKSTSVFRVLANHSASFSFFFHPPPSRYYTDLRISPSLSTNLGWRSSGSLTSVSLWGLSIQTQKGRGNFLLHSSQWETTWQSAFVVLKYVIWLIWNCV